MQRILRKIIGYTIALIGSIMILAMSLVVMFGVWIGEIQDYDLKWSRGNK